MMTTKAMPVAAINDADLVSASLAGNRDAFGQIVARYQSLVCSLAYNATGSLSQSEDLAQETFVAAWKQLAGLREPEKLRSWLCGIARNLILNTLRRQGREPSHAAESIEEISESHSPEPQPAEHAITKEEQTILWRSLEKIPETYREPMILFYRENQSVEVVAEKLELTEDTVHQRLSRGRKLLSEEVTAFVEGALARTNPGQTFTLGVLAALPFTLASSAKAATVAVAAAKGGAAKGGAAATGWTFASVFGALLGPLLGLVGGYLGMKASLNSTRTPRERAAMIRYNKLIIAAVVVFGVSLPLYINYGNALWKSHPSLFIALGVTITAAYGVFIFITAWRFNRTFAKVRDEERQFHPEAFAGVDTGPMFATPLEYLSRATLFGLPLVHWRTGRLPGQKIQPAIGWIACGDVAYGILFASGGFAVGGISMGGASVGLISFGGFSAGLLTFGGLALGGVAMGGAAIGLIASGGIAIAWHAAIGGVAGAHELAAGGAALAKHANDSVARAFFLQHPWLNIFLPTTRNVFWTVCFAPIFLQMLVWKWWRQKMLKRITKGVS